MKQDNNFGELCHILSDFLSKTKQRHGTNGQNWSLTCVHAGVPQESILGLLSFLIYINILSDSLTSNVKLFVDDTSLFSVVHDENISPKELKWKLEKGYWLSFPIENEFQFLSEQRRPGGYFQSPLKKPTHPLLDFVCFTDLLWQR